MKTFLTRSETFVEDPSTQDNLSGGPEWVETPRSTLSSLPGLPSVSRERVHWCSSWAWPSRDPEEQGGSLIHPQGTSFDCWVCASGRIFWILCQQLEKSTEVYKRLTRDGRVQDLLNLSFITLKIRIASHLAIRHWDAKSLVKFLSFQAVRSALPT